MKVTLQTALVCLVMVWLYGGVSLTSSAGPAGDSRVSLKSYNVTKSSAAPAAVAAGYKAVAFDYLGKFRIPMQKQMMHDYYRLQAHLPPELEFTIPKDILALNGQNVEVTGYMLPMEDPVKNKVRKFILLRNPVTCCFGCANQLNEFIEVAMQNGKKAPVSDMPITVRGKMAVGGVFESGVLVSIYQLAGEAAVDPG